MDGSAEPVVACREVVASWCHVSTTVVEIHVERKNSTRTPYWTPRDVKVDGTLVENGGWCWRKGASESLPRKGNSVGRKVFCFV